MKKPALCITRESLDIDFNVVGLHDIVHEDHETHDARLVPRELCETDESLLQLIPYIVLRGIDGGIFCYERGEGGGESRLHAKLSIGLGGHVDKAPGAEGLEELLLAEGERELLEETGISTRLPSFTSLIYTGGLGSAVDKVHLGLLTEHRMTVEQEIMAESNIIDKGRFMPLSELLRPDVFDRLEPWSQAVALGLRDELSRTIGMQLDAVGRLLYRINIESNTGITSFAAQEVGAVLSAIGHNLKQRNALARVYDDDEAAEELVEVAGNARETLLLLGQA